MPSGGFLSLEWWENRVGLREIAKSTLFFCVEDSVVSPKKPNHHYFCEGKSRQKVVLIRQKCQTTTTLAKKKPAIDSVDLPKTSNHHYYGREMIVVIRRKQPNHHYFGEGFSSWSKAEHPQPYNSWGNGSAIQVSACGERIEGPIAYRHLCSSAY